MPINRFTKKLLRCSLLALWCLPGLLKGQTCGDESIENARSDYQMGNFQPAIQKLKRCIEQENGFPTEQDRLSAHRWLAKLYLALDSNDRAVESVYQILEIDDTYKPPLEDPLAFRIMVSQSKQNRQVTQISSVSKSAESLFESPATVIVLTHEELMQRGYIDLEALFSDLPGFDVSRTYGSTYSNLYQRGYRSSNTDRTLFMINGIEENDFWGNWAYWARQYPLTMVKRVEVIYGPASTMYGANAFLGVVNVVTYSPEELMAKSPSGRGDRKGALPLGIAADVGYGSFQTAHADLSISGVHQRVSFLVTGRRFTSSGMDLSSATVRDFDSENPVTEFDYNPDDYNRFDYAAQLGNTLVDATWDDPEGYFDVSVNDAGDSVATLNDRGAAAARNADKAALDEVVGGERPGFANTLEHWYLSGELRVGNFVGGYQFWRSEHSPGTYGTDNTRATSLNGDLWVPQQSHYFLKYSDALGKKLLVSNIAQYRLTTVTDETRITSLRNYSNGSLDANDLIQTRSAFWSTRYFYQSSRQFRNELKLVYLPSDRFTTVSGIEVRNSAIQGDYITTTSAAAADSSVAEIGSSSLDDEPGGNLFLSLDLGAYSQGTYEVLKNRLRTTVGARLDFNRVRQTGGYGLVFNPRLALVYTPGKATSGVRAEAPWVWKVIYASAFKDASNREKYSLGTTRTESNPNLDPERVQNIEVSGAYHPNQRFFADWVVYQSWYSGAIGEVPVSPGSADKKNEAIGKLQVLGLQATASYRFYWVAPTNKQKAFQPPCQVYANLSLTRPRNNIPDPITQEPTGEFQPVGDIANVRLNAGTNLQFWRHPRTEKERLNFNLRANYIVRRPTGEDTSVPQNPESSFPAVFLLHSALTWQPTGVSGLRLQLVVNNLLNHKYFDPGIRSARPYRVPQPTRNYTLRLTYIL